MNNVTSLNFSIFAMVLTGILFWIIWMFVDKFDYEEDFVYRWLGRASAFIASFYAGVNFQCLYNDIHWVSPWSFICGNFYISETHVYLASFVFATMVFFVMLIAAYTLLAEVRGGFGILFLLAALIFLPAATFADAIYTAVITNVRWLMIVSGVLSAAICVGFAICNVARLYDGITYDSNFKMKG